MLVIQPVVTIIYELLNHVPDFYPLYITIRTTNCDRKSPIWLSTESLGKVVSHFITIKILALELESLKSRLASHHATLVCHVMKSPSRRERSKG